MTSATCENWTDFEGRYATGEWRATVFRDMVVSDAQRIRDERGRVVVLDIGCGGGFDNDRDLQNSIATVADRYIGVEPDPAVELSGIFSETHRCFFEDAKIEPGSIDLAFAVMVLEHLEHPQRFWDKLHEALAPGGVFWGFTMDARHFFVLASTLTAKLGVKDLYLNKLHGARGEDRYENYPVFYRSNRPDQIDKLTARFSARRVFNFGRVGQLDFYLPERLRWVGRALDRGMIATRRPGTLLAVRAQK